MSSLLAMVVMLGGLAAPEAMARDDEAKLSDKVDVSKAYQAIQRKAYRIAIGYLSRAERTDPDNPDIHNLLGYSYRHVSDFRLAHRHYARALELDPDHVNTREYLGQLHLQQGNPDLARAELTRIGASVRCDPGCTAYDSLEAAISEHLAKSGG